jgi:hypothetical protein
MDAKDSFLKYLNTGFHQKLTEYSLNKHHIEIAEESYFAGIDARDEEVNKLREMLIIISKQLVVYHSDRYIIDIRNKINEVLK